MKNILFYAVYLVLTLTACKDKDDNGGTVTPTPTPTTPVLVFNSGFEGSTSITNSNGQTDQISGIDNSLSTANDWLNTLQNKNGFGGFRFYYEQGDNTQRWAKIVADPTNAANKVLQFAILKPHITLASGEVKARVQVEQYGGTGIKEFYQSVRLYLPADFNKFNTGTVPTTGDWITLFEYWNNASWVTNATYPFRVSVNMFKATSGLAGSPLCFDIHGQTLDVNSGNIQPFGKALIKIFLFQLING